MLVVNVQEGYFNGSCCIRSVLRAFFSPSHLSASKLRSGPAWIATCQCFLSFATSVVIWFLAILSFTISALVCLDFAFHLVLSSVMYFSWPHFYPAFARVKTISTSSLWGLLSSGTCVPLFRCLRVFGLAYLHASTHTQTHMHARTDWCTATHTYRQTHMHTHWWLPTCMHAHTHWHVHTHKHQRKRAHTHACTHARTPRTHACTPARTHPYTH